jgi:hypothetical protein
VYKCVTDGRVEYRDVACAGGARQQVIDITATPADVDASAQAVAAERLKTLREADAALSARLAHEHELRLQLAAEEALAAQRARAAEAERRAAVEAETSVGVYWPIGHWHRRRYHRPAVHRWPSRGVMDYSRDFAGPSVARPPQRTFGFGMTPEQTINSR